MIPALIAAAGQVGAAAVGGPPPSSNAYGGTTSTPNSVTYNKGPSQQVLVGIAAAVLLVWLWRRRK